ncbi:MAG TPA: dTDP-4-amino-4,6-dideoxygalactose transaminase, partial [Bacteroidota bacterium]|nr:dTDP-4-amino-4,6-dideoxygalactose transaminase [Bacteroidota bacterium]
VNAFVLRGARPVFIDVRPTTLNLDESQLERLITSRTKAIVPVHYAGVGCAMERIIEVAQSKGIAVVEDNAHGLFGKYRGKYLGTFGALATQSFHETKNFVCGEGGALLLNDPAYVERAEIIREKGTDRSRFFRGQVDKYTWVDIGSSYLPSDLLAAFLFGQLEKRDIVQARRKEIWDRYHARISPWAEEAGLQLPVIPEGCDHPHHMYYILTPSLAKRQSLISHLKDRGISAVFHYLPLHLSGMGRRFGGKPGDCPVTEDISERLLRLPFYYELKEEEQDSVVRALKEFFL